MAALTLGVCLGGLIGLGAAERLRHRRVLGRIPLRIHVNGTRGKSSVTRLIAAGLRQAGKKVVAKTTGTLPRLILQDGTEVPIYRNSRPNVIEQVRSMRRALEAGAEAIVFECMALQPALQWLSESELLRATHTVITNARADHLEVMGPTEKDVALALAGCIAPNATTILGCTAHEEVFRKAAQDRESNCLEISRKHLSAVSEEVMANFGYAEHPENVALALYVCELLGVAREVALQGMWDAAPDPGALTIVNLNFFGRHLVFVNGFAANDPESSARIWQQMCDRFPHQKRRIMVFNSREDRPERSLQFGDQTPSWAPADAYLVTGSGGFIWARAARKRGLDVMKIHFSAEEEAAEVFERILELCGDSALIVGLGNIAGVGLALARYFEHRSIAKGVKGGL